MKEDVSARLDGYDVDVEEEIRDQPSITKTIAAVHEQLILIDKTVPITSFSTQGFDNSPAQSLDFLNMQRYDGGAGRTPDKYLRATTGPDSGNSQFSASTCRRRLSMSWQTLKPDTMTETTSSRCTRAFGRGASRHTTIYTRTGCKWRCTTSCTRQRIRGLKIYKSLQARIRTLRLIL